MNIIEPCCAERQLGLLLREERGHVVAFQTNGDVTLEHWMKAVMLMSGDRPRTLTIAVPVFTEAMMRYVAKYMRLEWVSKLRLMTTDPLPQEILWQFAAKVGIEVNALLKRIELAADASVPDGLMSFCGPEGTVVLQGRIVDAVTPGFLLYAGVLGKVDSPAVRSITDTWNAHFRARRYNINEELTINKEELAINDNGNSVSGERLEVSGERLEVSGSQTTKRPKKQKGGEK